MGNRRKLRLASLNGNHISVDPDRVEDAIDEAMQKVNVPQAGAINAYVCNHCHKLAVVQHVDAGTTPMYMACLSTDGCEGVARSARYPANPPQKVIDAVRWEWYKPDAEEFEKLSQEMKQHVRAGGLVLRPKDLG